MRRYLRIIDQPVEVDSGTVSRVAREPFGLEGEALLGAFDHGLDRANFGLADGARCLDVHDDAELHVNQIIVGISKERRPAHGPVHWAAGSDGETNLGATSLAAPNAASSSVARYSLVARLTASASSSLFHRGPGVDRCLLASASIGPASTAKPSPPTRPAPMHAPTTRSNTLRKMPLSRNRSLRARENAE